MKKIIIAAVVVLAVLTLVFSYFAYPVESINDGAWYMVPGIRLAEVHRLDNPIVFTGDHADGSGPFLSFMPFFPIFLSIFLAPGAHLPLPIQALLVVGAINVLTLIFSAWILYKIATLHNRRLDWIATFLIVTSLIFIMRASWSFGGRAETLVRLFFTIGFAILLRMRWSWKLAVGLGVLLGFMAATHPITPILFFVLIGCAVTFQEDMPVSLKYLATIAGVGFLTFVLVMQLSPYSIPATLAGIRGFSSQLGINPSGGVIVRLLKSSYIVVYAVIGLALAFFGGRLFLRALRQKQIATPSLFIVFALISLGFIVGVLAIGRTYYIAPFLLIVFAMLIYYVVHVNQSSLARYGVGILMLILLAVSAKYFLLFPSFIKNGVSLPAARASLAGIVAEHPGLPISLGGSQAWLLSDNYSNMIDGDASQVPGVHEYLYVQEEEGLGPVPPSLPGCVLEDNEYSPQYIPGYGFAVYDCHV